MNILFTICARAGSKGVRGKNTKEFCGQPLLNYTAAVYDLFAGRYGSLYDHVCLALNTDSELLFSQMETLNIPFLAVKREERLAGDVVSKKDVIKDTLIKCEEKEKMIFDTVIDLDLTSPLRTVDDVKGTMEQLLSDEKADISFSVTNARRSPYFNMVERKEDGYYRTVARTSYTARQQAPACYDMNASIYAYRRKYLLGDNIFERRAVIWNMPDTGVLDIDSEEDLKLMEVVGKFLFERKAGYRELFEWRRKR